MPGVVLPGSPARVGGTAATPFPLERPKAILLSPWRILRAHRRQRRIAAKAKIGSAAFLPPNRRAVARKPTQVQLELRVSRGSTSPRPDGGASVIAVGYSAPTRLPYRRLSLEPRLVRRGRPVRPRTEIASAGRPGVGIRAARSPIVHALSIAPRCVGTRSDAIVSEVMASEAPGRCAALRSSPAGLIPPVGADARPRHAMQQRHQAAYADKRTAAEPLQPRGYAARGRPGRRISLRPARSIQRRGSPRTAPSPRG